MKQCYIYIYIYISISIYLHYNTLYHLWACICIYDMDIGRFNVDLLELSPKQVKRRFFATAFLGECLSMMLGGSGNPESNNGMSERRVCLVHQSAC